jgi:UDP-N-acetylmuramate-alanine ligase
VTVIDDYGHHPTEIRVTLAAAAEQYPVRRILCAFHPHTFTRTIALRDQFATAFVDADRTYVMDIFGSARELPNNFSPSREGELEGEGNNISHRAAIDLASAISTHGPAVASGTVEQTVTALARDVRPDDVVICMGAGENDRVARGLVEQLRQRVRS